MRKKNFYRRSSKNKYQAYMNCCNGSVDTCQNRSIELSQSDLVLPCPGYEFNLPAMASNAFCYGPTSPFLRANKSASNCYVLIGAAWLETMWVTKITRTDVCRQVWYGRAGRLTCCCNFLKPLQRKLKRLFLQKKILEHVATNAASAAPPGALVLPG